MKRIVLSLCLGLASAVYSSGAAAPGASPEVHADRTVTFRVTASKATEVTLTGDWMNGAQKLTKADDGVWSIKLGPFAPSTYIYSFSVDGVATTDPVNPLIKLRARGAGSLLEVRSETPGMQEARDVPRGAVEVNWPKAPALGGETRRVLVYTPPGYAQEASRRYPVLLLLHGSNDTSDGWTNVGNVNFLADNLIAEKKMVPMVIVMTNFYPASPSAAVQRGGANAAGEGGGRGGRGGGGGNATFYKYLLEDVLPAVEAKYRIAPGRENHAVAGMSMGANQALDVFFRNFEQFNSVGALSASNYGQLESANAAFFADAKTSNAKIGVFWIGCGRQDPSHFNGSQRIAEVLAAKQINHVWRPTEGWHNYALWRDHLEEFMPLLFQKNTATK